MREEAVKTLGSVADQRLASVAPCAKTPEGVSADARARTSVSFGIGKVAPVKSGEKERRLSFFWFFFSIRDNAKVMTSKASRTRRRMRESWGNLRLSFRAGGGK